MWADAFKSDSGKLVNIGVLGVPGVPWPRKASVHAGLIENEVWNTSQNKNVPGVPVPMCGTPGTPRNTGPLMRCSSIETPRKPSIHAGLAFSGTPGTPGTPEKQDEPKRKARIGDTSSTYPVDLVRDFMEDGLTREEAEALAAISVQPRPPDEWLALIAELDALIVRYCLATGETKTAIQSARCGQSLASIPESLAWFRREVARIDGAEAKPVTTPAPIRSEIIEGSRAGAKAARMKLHQPITKELNQ